jgi:biotin operon repressor
MNSDKEIKLLEDIKKLLMLQLVKGLKVSSEEVGEVLGVTGRAVRNVATSQKKPRKKKEK